MSLVGKVGRNRPRARFAMAALYGILGIGAITTLYPFLLMISTGFKGPTDQNDNRLIPSFTRDDNELYAKYLDDKYAGAKPEIEATRSSTSTDGTLRLKYQQFLLNLEPIRWRAGFALAPGQRTSRLRMAYQDWLKQRYGSIDTVNRKYVEEAMDFQTIDLPAELLDRKSWQPPQSPKYQDWVEFKRTLPAEFRIPIFTKRLFQRWAASKWQNRFADVPPEVKGTATSFETLPLNEKTAAFAKFRSSALPGRYLVSTESLWLKEAGTPETPIEAAEKAFVEANRGEIRREFSTRNYRYVLNYILLNSRALLNTTILCFLTILTQLIVNPVAAYALSRYPIRQSGRILMFLLATMAFPAEVAMIPSFLLLKNLGLLNTFAALVLPGAASGYMIFLLKGFFDSMPQELFEAASLDGAPETTMMARVALPLARPVLGYLALLAFMGAYGAFMFAFLICQDQKMWTLTVWLYQLQSDAPRSVTMAAVTLAAIPTLVVFLAAQRVILRGIVLPGER